MLSDRKFGPQRVPVSPLLAVGRVHHHLVQLRKRLRAGLFVESGEPREVHQFATLVSLGWGAWFVPLFSAMVQLRLLSGT